MGIWEYGDMRVWEYGDMRVWEYGANPDLKLGFAKDTIPQHERHLGLGHRGSASATALQQ